jgi:hypothetical protein
MRCSLLFFFVLLAAYPVSAQNNQPNPSLQEQPFSPQLRDGEPQSFGRPRAMAAPSYPSTGSPAPAQAPASTAMQTATGSSKETQYSYQVLPPAPAADPPTIADRFRESTWYTRVDYFHWNERLDGSDFVNEDGTLATVGYETRVDRQRYRGELFGATMLYSGSSQSDDPNINGVPLHSTTTYLGFRLEYDLLFEPEGLPQVSFFAGLGTRFWIRDMKDDFDDHGNFIWGYQETWWTFYPYIGIEKRRTHDDNIEFYYSARLGCTPITYERIEDMATNLYPQIGLTGKLEIGIRSRRFLLAGYFEGMSWCKSEVVRDSLQPASSMTTAGLQAGFSF